MAGIGKKYTKLEWGQKTLNGINVTFKWNGAPSNPVHPRYTWDEVELIQHAAGEDFKVWEQKDKDKLVKLILKLNGKTITESKRKQIKQYKIKVSDIKLAIKNISNVEIMTENIKF
jgi:hypothetical protein